MALFGKDNPFASITRRVGAALGVPSDIVEAANLINPATWAVEGGNRFLGLFSRGEGVQGAISRSAADKRLSIATQLQTGEIDVTSRDEIMSLLQAGQVDRALQVTKEARAGTLPKYKARQATQRLYETIVDQPGARQTRDTGVASLLMGNQFRGRGAGR